MERAGAAGADPVYGVLIEHDDGLFLFDTGFDLEHMNAVLPFELPEQTPGADDPGAARARRLLDLAT